MNKALKLTLSVLALVVTGVIGAAAFITTGAYDVAANSPHTQPVYSLLELTMKRSVQQRAADIRVPALDRSGLLERGAVCYRDKCLQCHGGPGTAQGEIGRSMQPLPGPLADARSRWTPAELYWITRNGITMSGMPAWKHRLADGDIWALVAFMQRLPDMTVADFRHRAGPQVAASCEAAPANAAPGFVPAADRGRRALSQYACNACHVIPGVTGSDVHVGPPLAGIASRSLIAGRLANDTAGMVRWLKDPQSAKPQTAMPDMQLSDEDARDMAAYLSTLR